MSDALSIAFARARNIRRTKALIPCHARRQPRYTFRSLTTRVFAETKTLVVSLYSRDNTLKRPSHINYKEDEHSWKMQPSSASQITSPFANPNSKLEFRRLSLNLAYLCLGGLCDILQYYQNYVEISRNYQMRALTEWNAVCKLILKLQRSYY